MNVNIKTANNYSENDFKNFPFWGWLKPCFNKNCRTITGKKKIVLINQSYKYIYICKDCSYLCSDNNFLILNS